MKPQTTQYSKLWPKWRLGLLCVPVALMLLALSAQAQDDVVLPPIGGHGGNRFFARCQQGEMLTGFDLRTGDDVDAIRPICSPTGTGKYDFYPLSFGGNGGGPRQLICPGDIPIVIGMLIGYEGKEILSVNNIHLFCGIAAAAQAPRETPDAVFDGPAEEWGGGLASFVTTGNDTQRCPTGLVAVGISGRSGGLLDAVGLICGPPPGSQTNAQDSNKPPPVALGKVHGTTPAPPIVSRGGEPLICARARDARARNSPSAPDLETQCRAAGGSFADRMVMQPASGHSAINTGPASHVGIFAPSSAAPAAAPSVTAPPAESGHTFVPPVFADGTRLWACSDAAHGLTNGGGCKGVKAGKTFCRLQGFSGALQMRADGSPGLTLATMPPGNRGRAINGDACTANNCVVVAELHCAP